MTYVLKMCGCGRGTVYALGLCRPCYSARWRQGTEAPITHGTWYAYATRGCRCTSCREAGQKYMADRRARKRAERG